jgi:hypothetical protein
VKWVGSGSGSASDIVVSESCGEMPRRRLGPGSDGAGLLWGTLLVGGGVDWSGLTEGCSGRTVGID